jgi:hypothetical protein
MQNWHILYNTETGKSVSIATPLCAIANPLPEHLTALSLTDEQGEGLQSGTLKWDEKTRTLVATPASTVTAEQAVSAHFSPYQIAALSRLEMALLQTGKPLGVKMTAAKQWLEGVMLAWAVDPTPQESFGQPQATFAEASAEAVTDLTGRLSHFAMRE